jgi:hypothetical protein
LSRGEFRLYQTPYGQARIQLRVKEGTVWLSQKQLAELYQVSVPAIAQYVRSIFEEGELIHEATINDHLIVAGEGAAGFRSSSCRPGRRFNENAFGARTGCE